MEEKEITFELVENRDALELVPRWEPEAWWFFAAAGLIMAMVLLGLILKRRKKVHDPSKGRREAYETAKKELGTMGGDPIRETALKVSLSLRGYLARSLNEPALFETHEEFIGRHDGLKELPEEIRSEIGGFFSHLAAMKYAPVDNAAVSPPDLRDRGLVILERIHRA